MADCFFYLRLWFRRWMLSFFLFFAAGLVHAQTSPVGWMDMDATLRNLQLLGQLDPNISFAVRPLHYKQEITQRKKVKAKRFATVA